MSEPDTGMHPAVEGSEGSETSSGGTETSSNGGETSVRKIAQLVIVVGVALIGYFITTWVSSVFVIRNAGHWAPRRELSNQVFWRSWAAVLNANYVYLVIGVVLCLLAIHVVNDPRWNRLIQVLIAFLGLVIVILLVGFIVVVFILDWHEFTTPNIYNPLSTTLLFIVLVAALVAIILVETPKLRETIEKWVSKKDSTSEPTEQKETDIPDQDEP